MNDISQYFEEEQAVEAPDYSAYFDPEPNDIPDDSVIDQAITSIGNGIKTANLRDPDGKKNKRALRAVENAKKYYWPY